VSSELLLNVALQMASIDRQIIGVSLDQEGIETATVLNGAKRMSDTERPSASDCKVTWHRFGKNLRLVLWFEWLTSCPL
jgi:hypothetical protein